MRRLRSSTFVGRQHREQAVSRTLVRRGRNPVDERLGALGASLRSFCSTAVEGQRPLVEVVLLRGERRAGSAWRVGELGLRGGEVGGGVGTRTGDERHPEQAGVDARHDRARVGRDTATRLDRRAGGSAPRPPVPARATSDDHDQRGRTRAARNPRTGRSPPLWSRAVVRFDPYSYEHHEDPYPTYRRLRDEAPAYLDPERGFWALSRHDDVRAAIDDWPTFSSTGGITLERRTENVEPMLIEMDPPRHTELRALVSRAFTPKRVAELEAPIRDLAARAVRRLRARRPGRRHRGLRRQAPDGRDLA